MSQSQVASTDTPQHPGLRQNQMRDILYKQFQKAPENRACPCHQTPSTSCPGAHVTGCSTAFNQAQVAYNASKDERVDALRQVMDAREAKYKVDS